MNPVEIILVTDIVAEKGYEYYTVRDPITKKLTLCRKRYVYRHHPHKENAVAMPQNGNSSVSSGEVPYPSYLEKSKEPLGDVQ